MSDPSCCDSCGRPQGLWAIDRLTLLLDRWGWDEQAPLILAGSASTALLVVDLDNFKRVNDRFGHVAGDEVLKAVADTLRRITRKGDLVGRYGGQGGDEFLVLLPETSEDEALVVAERIRAGIRSMVVAAPTEGGTRTLNAITVSIGLAVGTPATDLQTLVLEADTALRSAKRTGRDRVLTVGGEEPKPSKWRAARLPLAIMTACAAGVVIAASTGTPVPAEQNTAAEIPQPTTTSQQPPTVTVLTTVTATTTAPAPPPAPIRKPQQPPRRTPAATSSAQPAPRAVEPPPASSKRVLCPACNVIMNDLVSAALRHR